MGILRDSLWVFSHRPISRSRRFEALPAPDHCSKIGRWTSPGGVEVSYWRVKKNVSSSCASWKIKVCTRSVRHLELRGIRFVWFPAQPEALPLSWPSKCRCRFAFSQRRSASSQNLCHTFCSSTQIPNTTKREYYEIYIYIWLYIIIIIYIYIRIYNMKHAYYINHWLPVSSSLVNTHEYFVYLLFYSVKVNIRQISICKHEKIYEYIWHMTSI